MNTSTDWNEWRFMLTKCKMITQAVFTFCRLASEYTDLKRGLNVYTKQRQNKSSNVWFKRGKKKKKKINVTGHCAHKKEMNENAEVKTRATQEDSGVCILNAENRKKKKKAYKKISWSYSSSKC